MEYTVFCNMQELGVYMFICVKWAGFEEENFFSAHSPLFSAMIDYYGNAPRRWCVFVAHGIWPLSLQRALQEGGGPGAGGYIGGTGSVLTARQKQTTTRRVSRAKTCPRTQRELETETSAEFWRRKD